MSQTGQDRPSVLRAARERTRAEITRQILDAARRHLATEGASGLSLRAIARELGASSSAVYRYVASRDDLLTRLIVAAYDALGAAAETAEAAVARDDLAGRWSAVCGAVRAWALANPNEYALIYGTPVPGYTAPPATIAPAARVSSVLLGILADAAGRPTPTIAGDDVPPDGRKALAPARSIVRAGGARRAAATGTDGLGGAVRHRVVRAVRPAARHRRRPARRPRGVLRRIGPPLGGAGRHHPRPHGPRDRKPRRLAPAGSGDNRHGAGRRNQRQPYRERSELMTSAPPGQPRATGRRLDPKYAPILIPAIMAIAMSFVMSLVQTIARLGFTPNLASAWLTSFAIGVAVAIPTAILVAPRAQRLVGNLTGAPRRSPPDKRR